MTISNIKASLREESIKSKKRNTIYYKIGKGDYAEHDRFLGVTVPFLRKLAKEYEDLSLSEVQELIESPINEERLFALIILVNQYKKSPRDEIFDFYLSNIEYINNWNLVDASAHLIIGAHLYNADRSLLVELAKSDIMWERRIAIVSSWYFIRKNDLDWTYKIAKLLFADAHDLIHKATGWMLREAGKRDEKRLRKFLDQYHAKIPRTMLRYSIEKFDEEIRKSYLFR